ncbi:MAG: GAF domain-containing protein [Candidatus Nanopelagicales bacterium]
MSTLETPAQQASVPAQSTAHPTLPAVRQTRESLMAYSGMDRSRQGQRAGRSAERALWAAGTRAVLEAVPVRVMVSDAQRVVRHLNSTAELEMDALMGTIGLRGRDLVGLPIDVLNATPGYIDSDPGTGEGPATFVVDNGQDVVEVTVSPIERDGVLVGSIAAWSSVSDRVNQERILAEVAAENAAAAQLLRALHVATTRTAAAAAALQALIDHLGWDFGSVWFLAPGGEEMEYVCDAGSAPAVFLEQTRRLRLPRTVGLAGRAWVQRDLVIVDDVESAHFLPRREAAITAGFRRALCIPIMLDGEVVGAIDAFSVSDSEIRSSRRDSLRNLGLMVSSTVSRVASAEEARETAKDTAAVAALLTALMPVATQEAAARTALATVRSVLDWDYGSFWFLDEDEDVLRFGVDSGDVDSRFALVSRESSYRRGQGLSGRAWLEGGLVVVDDLSQVTDCTRAAVARETDLSTAICFPVMVDGRTIATMDFVARSEVPLTPARIETLRTISRLVSQTFSRVIAEEREREQAQELQAAVDAMLETVDAAADGDLTVPVAQYDGTNESIAQMNVGLAGLLERLKSSVAEIASTGLSARSAGDELGVVSMRMTNDARDTSEQVEHLEHAAQRVTEHIGGVLTAADELQSSITEIAKSASAAAEVAGQAVDVAANANESVTLLTVASEEIGSVVKTISSIAQQTNLLALNATIEAARAGAAGKGFAVVANEVKELAKETARATEEISRQVGAIQDGTAAATASITQISAVIDEINDHQTAISSAVEEQTATTGSMARNVSAVADSVEAISSSIVTVGQAADSTRSCAMDSERAALGLSSLSNRLQELISGFRY